MTLIAPSVVVTATHCIVGANGPAQFTVGFGSDDDADAAAAGPRRQVTAVHRHPHYRRGSWNDLTVLELDAPVTDRAPAVIAPATTTCNHRSVGYGFASAEGGVAGDRKSVQTCIEARAGRELIVRDLGGSTCYGDSGGPLFIEGTDQIVAVLSRGARDPTTPICAPGSFSYTTALWPYAEFIKQWAPTAFVPVPAPGPPVTSCTLLEDEPVTGTAFQPTAKISGRVKIDGLTDLPGPAPRVVGEIGVGGAMLGSSRLGFEWYRAEYESEDADGERWSGSVTPLHALEVNLQFRFSTDGGYSFTECDPAKLQKFSVRYGSQH